MREKQNKGGKETLPPKRHTQTHTTQKHIQSHKNKGRNCTEKHKKATTDPRTNNRVATLSALTKSS